MGVKSMTESISAKVIADSVSPEGKRITTFELEYHRYILAELNTHAMTARNTASSRAIPIQRMIDLVMEQPVNPVEWGRNRAGMQATETLDETESKLAEHVWDDARRAAVRYATDLMNLGVHKQVVNRLLEPFQKAKTVLTATELNNFFTLRRHCLSTDSEILTASGWKPIADVKVGEMVMSLNESGVAEQATVIDTVYQKSDGFAFSIKGQSVDMLVSEGHKVLFLNEDGRIGKDTAKNLEGKRIRIPKNQFGISSRCNERSVEFSEGYIIGAMLGNGWLIEHEKTRNYYVVLSKGGEHADRVLNGFLGHVKAVFGDVSFRRKTTSCEEIHISGKRVFEWFKPIIGNKSTKKHLPVDFRTFSKEKLVGIYRGLVETDGNVLSRTGGEKFYTSSEQLANDFQELLFYIGWSGSITTQDRVGRISRGKDSRQQEYCIETKNISYVCHVNKNRNSPMLKTPIEKVAYDGDFACVTLEKNNTILVRRNGKVAWSGNCDAQPEIRVLAERMKEAMDASTPNQLQYGEWHTPYFDTGFWSGTIHADSLEDALAISSSCCAQVSYRKLDQSIEKARDIYHKLVTSKPVHASAFAHCATPIRALSQKGVTHERIDDGTLWSGQFQGWVQYRQLIEENYIKG